MTTSEYAGEGTSRARMDILSRELSDALQRASPERARAALAVACEMAVERARLATAESDEALTAVHSSAGTRKDLEERLTALADAFDDEYFALDESDDPADRQASLTAFYRARAASALALAFSAERHAVHEAIYEAAIATGKAQELVATLLALLR